ncbi:MAG: Stp1/IreP family PP2C-type Ser/Thr phosphatase [Methylovulum sp.]|uniref:Stp1/IreP family PP2C-type Ser/Thr phosphatase n=1 Tax=Methylovulum sp. TaxID=1916980 RepID=UPI0026184670|nr:Stp1/IreP family PP2C-type Ser/Thr phosphatase [Methylovulum sp.]MDD2722687.1 Stp1/IreP family PP2C-type Ser/Thr phosphatase [Methylovulum sp.]MDD5124226.1 Stp1/IreP family PP2C-type Ser/Thr phosphatase [Methylovulum sp.]
MAIAEDYVISVALASDIGCHRQNNEDTVKFFSLSGNVQTGLAIVADGMGGHKAGEVASQEAVDVIGEWCLAHHFADPQQTLVNAYLAANQRVYRHSSDHHDCRGMGTTVTALLIANGMGCYAHVGDSRLYSIRDRHITQMTQDHTLVAQMLEYGMITAEQAKVHPQKNILTNALGTNPDILVDVSDILFPIQIGDSYLLCSDGLFEKITDDEILHIIVNNSPEEACTALVDAAIDRGGNDNISVIVLAVQNNY